jgi:UDP-3-O-acyl-N-acetylglucosamine deacetylase
MNQRSLQVDSACRGVSARKLLTLIDGQSQAYVNLIEKHGLTEERQKKLTQAMAEYSDY